MKIAVAGAGIAGFAAATFLARAGHDVQIFDQFEAPRPVGSGLMINGQIVGKLTAVNTIARCAARHRLPPSGCFFPTHSTDIGRGAVMRAILLPPLPSSLPSWWVSML